MASLSSLVASKGRGRSGDTWRAFRRRCVDLDFSILEIEMMRHIIGHTHREARCELVTQPTMQVGKGITCVKAMQTSGGTKRRKNTRGQIIESGKGSVRLRAREAQRNFLFTKNRITLNSEKKREKNVVLNVDKWQN